MSERKFVIFSKNKVENSHFILSEINSKISLDSNHTTHNHTGPKFRILVQPKCMKAYKVKSICFRIGCKKTKLHFPPERSPGSSNVGRRVIYSWWVLLYTEEFKYAELSTSLHVWGACQFTQGFCRCQTAPSPQWRRQILQPWIPRASLLAD